MFKIKIAIFPGKFDPITLSHLNILQRALRIFDKIIILILNDISIKSKISVPNRLDLINMAIDGINNVEADYWEQSVTKYAEISGASAIIESIKNDNNINNKFEEYGLNKILNPKIETVFFPVSSKYYYINSKLTRELINRKENLDLIVPPTIVNKLTKILSEV